MGFKDFLLNEFQKKNWTKNAITMLRMKPSR